MGFVDGKEGDCRLLQQREHARLIEALRGDVQQVQFPAPQCVFDLAGLLGIKGRIKKRSAHAEQAQGINLVLHQCDERRHHHAATLAHQSGDLVAQRFAAAGGHDHHGIVASNEGVDDLVLGWAEGVEAEDRLQYGAGLAHLVPVALFRSELH